MNEPRLVIHGTLSSWIPGFSFLFGWTEIIDPMNRVPRDQSFFFFFFLVLYDDSSRSHHRRYHYIPPCYVEEPLIYRTIC